METSSTVTWDAERNGLNIAPVFTGIVSVFCSVAPVATPSGDVMMYWHALEYISTAVRQIKPLEVNHNQICVWF